MIVSNRGVDVVVEFGELADILPDVLERGVEDMGTVFVDVNSFDVLGVDIACDVIASIDHKTALADAMCLMGEYSTGDAGTHNEVVISSH